ncbi:MAG: penicillin-binding protein 2 [Patescibacteria group bacterium]|nr:penicillin-binding protein 2 [Patescibacteria group bacterium]MDE2144940.1 penicillin-binding protein 2 [Patescibacteria group bacterium]
MGFRISLLIGVFCFLYALLGFKLYNIQLDKGGYYSAKAASLTEWSSSSVSNRGSIYLTDSLGSEIPAAINRYYPQIYAVPKDIADASSTITKLDDILGSGNLPSNMPQIFQNKKSMYSILINRATQAQADAIDSAKIMGVYVNDVVGRYYPLGSLASQVIGYVSKNSPENGIYGAEKYYNNALNGSSGNGSSVSSFGGDIHLTIDRNIQSQAEYLLGEAVAKYQAAGGTFIVEDPSTGKILALANLPDFDPNSYWQYPVSSFLDPTIQNVFEPGSIMKPITMASALDAGAVQTSTQYYDSGKLVLNGQTIMDWDHKAHGWTDMTTVIADSLNIGAAFVEGKLGNAAFLNYLQKFGFSEDTGIDLPGEVIGSMRQLTRAHSEQIDYATASFGQGISATPMRMVEAISAIANHGVMMRPFIDADQSPKEVRRVVSATAADETAVMMEHDVMHGKLAEIPGYTVAGKSGTAQVPDLKTGGYTNQVIDSYIGFAPALNPKFVALIVLYKPAGAPLSGIVVPYWQQLASFILNYYNVPPDNYQPSSSTSQ